MKKETLEEIAHQFAEEHREVYQKSNYASMYFAFYWGANWQKEKADNYAIEFAEWAIDYSFNGMYSNDLKELLEEFKKEKGL